jgi:hypothetical protein
MPRPVTYQHNVIEFKSVPGKVYRRYSGYTRLYRRVAQVRAGYALQVDFQAEQTARHATTCLRSHAQHDGQRLGHKIGPNGVTNYYWLEKV